MKKIIFTTLLLSYFTLFTIKTNAQGCSDAGACSIRSIKNNAETLKSKEGSKNELSIGVGYGIGERSINSYTGYLEYTRSFSNRTSLTGKLSYNIFSGELANTSGPGDLFLSLNHSFDEKRKWKKSFIVGVKLPLDNADIAKNGINLPMPYQSSLGTVDLILGLSYTRKNWGATLALQQPLKSRNDNKFLASYYPDVPKASLYWPTNEFERKGDLVGRVSYNIKASNRFSIRPSLLGIYHLANDTYVDLANNRRPIYNSTGLTLNGNMFFNYTLKSGSGFELSLGTPFVVREQRPDGLTRKFVATVEYQFNF